MAIVDKYVVSIQRTHQRYGTGDTIGLTPAEFAAYQADAPGQDRNAWRNLIRLLHVDKPNGDRVHADEDGNLSDRVTPAAKVRADNEVRGKIHELVRAEKLSTDEEVKLCDKALGDPGLDVNAFLAPGGAEAYFTGKAAEAKPKKPATPAANRLGVGPQNTRG